MDAVSSSEDAARGAASGDVKVEASPLPPPPPLGDDTMSPPSPLYRGRRSEGDDTVAAIDTGGVGVGVREHTSESVRATMASAVMAPAEEEEGEGEKASTCPSGVTKNSEGTLGGSTKAGIKALPTQVPRVMDKPPRDRGTAKPACARAHGRRVMTRGEEEDVGEPPRTEDALCKGRVVMWTRRE